jgi:hypothetical protein
MQFYFVTLGLASHFLHHRQSAVCTSANDELAAFPRYVFFNGKWRVPKLVAELLGYFSLAFGDLAAVLDVS